MKNLPELGNRSPLLPHLTSWTDTLPPLYRSFRIGSGPYKSRAPSAGLWIGIMKPPTTSQWVINANNALRKVISEDYGIVAAKVVEWWGNSFKSRKLPYFYLTQIFLLDTNIPTWQKICTGRISGHSQMMIMRKEQTIAISLFNMKIGMISISTKGNHKLLVSLVPSELFLLAYFFKTILC